MISINYDLLKNKLGKLIETKKNKKFIIYPMGVQGALVKGILNGQYGIVEDYIIDNSLCQEKKWIHPVSLLGEIPCENYLVILTCENPLYIRDVIKSLRPYNIEYYNLFPESLERPENYSKNIYNDNALVDSKICNILKAGKPFAGGRLGNTESAIAYEYCKMRLGIQDSFSEKWSKWLLTTSGFFSSHGREKEDIERYAEMTIHALQDMDMHFVWDREGEAFLLRNYASSFSEFTWAHCIHRPWRQQGCTWMTGLRGKKVLVVSPFSESIKVQYDKRRELFENEENLPEFELLTYQTLQTQMGESCGFKDWFEAYQYMETEISQIDFDVAIVGCGAYGYPLTAAIKKHGKIAIEMCSSTQLMFGIKAKRWEREKPIDIPRWWNDAWIYPLETPPHYYKAIEDGAYWG